MNRDELRKINDNCHDLIGEVNEEELKKLSAAGDVEAQGIFHSISFCLTIEDKTRSCWPKTFRC